jgi:hypothetical protein
MLRVLGELMHVDDMGDTAKLVQGAQGGPPLEAVLRGNEEKDRQGSSEIPPMVVWNGIERIRPVVAPRMTTKPRTTAMRMGQ